MPGRNRVPSFQIASGTTNERDNSYNIPTGSIFYNTDTSNIELSGNVAVAGDISGVNKITFADGFALRSSGSLLKTTFLEIGLYDYTLPSNAAYHTITTKYYTKSNNTKLSVTATFKYSMVGYFEDDYESKISISYPSAGVVYATGIHNTTSGQWGAGGRSSNLNDIIVLSPSPSYDNVTGTITIILEIRRTYGDDAITIQRTGGYIIVNEYVV